NAASSPRAGVNPYSSIVVICSFSWERSVFSSKAACPRNSITLACCAFFSCCLATARWARSFSSGRGTFTAVWADAVAAIQELQAITRKAACSRVALSMRASKCDDPAVAGPPLQPVSPRTIMRLISLESKQVLHHAAKISAYAQITDDDKL